MTELSSSAGNIANEQSAHSRLPISRSVSIASAGSVVRYDTVERRGKSSSPDKKQHTLEWKKRLIDGELGYGDQTDLFGPSGLENIFQSPSRPTTANSSQPSQPFKNRFKHQDFPPSSPPPWPSNIDMTQLSSPPNQLVSSVHQQSSSADQGTCRRPNLNPVQQEAQAEENTHGQDIKYDYSNSSPSLPSVRVPDTSPYQLPGLGQTAAKTAFLQPSSCHQGNRTISGQTDYSGEAFSPVFISKHTTLDGRVNYAALDSKAVERLQSEDEISDLSILQTASRQLPAPTAPQHGDQDEFSEMQTVPEVSLPENLPTGTPPIAALGDFVNVKRGGLSMQGSFKTRPLSPSQSETMRQSVAENALYDEDELSDRSGARTPQPRSSASPKRPITPSARDGTTMLSPLLSPPKTRPSTSPLKLFGNYDTFTNNRLLRRMSQLEDIEQAVSSHKKHDSVDGPSEVSSVVQCERPAQRNLASQQTQSSQRQIGPSLSSFGEGELDEHDFEADLSIPTGLNLSEDESFEGSPPPGVAPPGSKTPFRFHLEESPDSRNSFKLKRKLSKRSTAKSRVSEEYTSVHREFYSEKVEESQYYIEGKRPRSSPSKAPTPKRRRTIVALNGTIPTLGHGSEIQVKITGASTDGSRSASLEDNGSWNRTRRNLTRPRNPTPSQYRDDHIHEEVGEATLQFLSSSPRLEAVKEKLDLTDIPEESLTAEQAQSVAAEVAAFTLNISKEESEGKRSRSITTQDFLDEAMHIMSLIRARGRPHSGLGNVEESDAEEAYGQHLRPENAASPSPSPLRLSRPPSREGGSTGWRPRSQLQHDPRVVSQLRRYQDNDELDLVESSLRSLNVDNDEDQDDVSAVTNTLSNVRIRGPRPETTKVKGESDDSHKSKSPTKTHGSNPSLDSSSSRRTVGTYSTRKSDNVATLAPETVAHLIPEEVGGMTFDREQQKWVRKSTKTAPRELPVSPNVHNNSNITSEDDPFDDIPDLTVDEMKELTRIGRSPTKDESFFDKDTEPSIYQDTRVNSNETVITRPVTRENQIAPPFTSSSGPSKYSVFGSSKQFGSSQQQVETRATSWSNEELANMKRSKRQTGQGLQDLAHVNMTHPISDISECMDEDDESEDESLPLDEDSVTEELPAPKHRQQQAWFQSSPGSMKYGPPRQMSLRRQTLHRGLHTTVQDQSEMSFIATLPDKRLMSVSLNLSRHPGISQELAVPSSSPARVDATFYLSDLPEFTVHEEDQEQRPSEKALAKRVAHHDAKDRYGMAVQSLVKTLTDVEPDEPFWEDIKQLSLRERDLGSVHNLEDFCTRLEDLDLSNNNIAHLEGAPQSIRRLNVRSNALSSLTAWSHLMNLQYLDISNNSIDSLAGLSMLVHLREVRADDNEVSSLDGIMGLDGLLKLSVRNNNLTSVDFEGHELNRLEELDLGSNQITELSHAESLPSLSRLVLDGNELSDFNFGTVNPKIASLSLQKNQLKALDVSNLTTLRYLNVDENELSTVQGLDKLFQVETLSMRKQRTPILSIFSQHLHMRTLYLSSNPLSTLDLPHSYHSIQTLELARCGLHSLPSDFGLKLPNLRSLNLAFNALKDIRPILNISRLHSLNIAGNRIARLRKTMATLGRMQHLLHFDARDNPMTLGFYPPTATAAISAPPPPHPAETSLVAMGLPVAAASGFGSPEDVLHQQLRAGKAYTLPLADPAADIEHMARLDEEAKLMRRVYEIMLAQKGGVVCLAQVDGLSFQREKVVRERDGVWERLVELGILKRTAAAAGAEQEDVRERDVGEGGTGGHGKRRVTPFCELEV